MEKHMGVFDWFRRASKEASRPPEASTEQAQSDTPAAGATAGRADETAPKDGEAEASPGDGIGIPKQQSKQEADAAREAVHHPEQETAPDAAQKTVRKPSGGADSETGESARR
ncbi:MULTISPECIES: hypothetical protein [unclassified Streptomyces]|uniref:hypothetical protein n=1 Tax=unclassified Streptomyces TaxID=2593676 RepID=UPI003369E47C